MSGPANIPLWEEVAVVILAIIFGIPWIITVWFVIAHEIWIWW